MQRAAMHIGAGAAGDLFAVLRHRHRHAAQVEAVQPPCRTAEHEQARAGIVGNQVDDLRIQIGDAAADDLDGRQAVADGADGVGQGRVFHVEVVVQHDGNLAFQPRLQHAALRHLVAVAQQHVGVEHAEGRLADAHRRLRALCAQRHLAADQPAAVLHPVVAVGGLDRVSLGEATAAGQHVAHRAAGRGGFLGLAQGGGDIGDGGHDGSLLFRSGQDGRRISATSLTGHSQSQPRAAARWRKVCSR